MTIKWPIAAAAGALILTVGYLVGFQSGRGWNYRRAEARISAREAKAAKTEAQVRYLLRVAYPPPVQQHPFNEMYLNKRPSSSVLKDIDLHKENPEVVRAILLEQIKKETETLIEESKGFPKGHPYWSKSFDPIFEELLKRSNELEEWSLEEDESPLGESITQ